MEQKVFTELRSFYIQGQDDPKSALLREFRGGGEYLQWSKVRKVKTK